MKPRLPTFQCPPGHLCGILGDRSREETVSLAELIEGAYQVKKVQIAGLPAWGDSRSDVYDLDARIAGDAPPAVGEVRSMLRTLLADRFQLRIHHETRLLSVYSLVPARSGVKLISDSAPCLVVPGIDGKPAITRRKPEKADGVWIAPRAFYPQLLTMFVKQAVVDRSALDGDGYSTADGVDPLTAISFETQAGASVFSAVEDQWGMKPESKKAPLDVIVVDRVERPSAN